MYCTKCGNKNDDSSNFCGVCGASLVKNEANNYQANENIDMNNQNYQNTNPNYSTQQYGYYNQNPNNPESRINAMALAGFITSCGFILFGGLAGLVGLILSLIGFHQTRMRNQRGKGFAVAGIIIGCLTVALTILLFIYISNADPYELRRYLDHYYDFDSAIFTAKALL